MIYWTVTRTDLLGRRFGSLTVVAFDATIDGRPHWLCQCDCGAIASKKAKYLINGDTSSCGCAQRAMRARGNVKHGGVIGGLSREYRSWRDAKERCYNPKKRSYRWYGALGVTMADHWRDSFAAFDRDMGPCPQGWTLDRIDPHGNYEPSNCRWASWAVQRVNKRRNTTRPSSAVAERALA